MTQTIQTTKTLQANQQIPLPLKIYHQRQETLLNQLPNNTLVIIESGEPIIRNRDVEYDFHVKPNFLYLTGLSSAHMYLCLIKHSQGFERILFAQDTDFEQEIWHGKRIGFNAAGQMLQAKAYNLNTFETHIHNWLAQLEHVAFNFESHDLSTLLKKLFAQLARKSRQYKRPKQSMIDIDPYLAQQRLIKDAHEKELMQQSANIAVNAHIIAMQQCKPGISELALDSFIEAHFKQHNAQHLAYNGIVAGGGNACILHHRASLALLQTGDLCLIDAGCEYFGYCSDITHTFPINGTFTAVQKDLYDLVLQANQNAIAQCLPGNSFIKPHTVVLETLTQGLFDLGLLKTNQYGFVQDAIENKAYQKFFMHKTSHYLGMDVHDVGDYFEDTQNAFTLDALPLNTQPKTLQSNMVLTIEPGLYIHPDPEIDEKFWNIGIRIEDDVWIEESNPTVLTKNLPRTTQAIEAIMKK